MIFNWSEDLLFLFIYLFLSFLCDKGLRYGFCVVVNWVFLIKEVEDEGVYIHLIVKTVILYHITGTLLQYFPPKLLFPHFTFYYTPIGLATPKLLYPNFLAPATVVCVLMTSKINSNLLPRNFFFQSLTNTKFSIFLPLPHLHTSTQQTHTQRPNSSYKSKTYQDPQIPRGEKMMSI